MRDLDRCGLFLALPLTLASESLRPSQCASPPRARASGPATASRHLQHPSRPTRQHRVPVPVSPQCARPAGAHLLYRVSTAPTHPEDAATAAPDSPCSFFPSWGACQPASQPSQRASGRAPNERSQSQSQPHTGTPRPSLPHVVQKSQGGAHMLNRHKGPLKSVPPAGAPAPRAQPLVLGAASRCRCRGVRPRCG